MGEIPVHRCACAPGRRCRWCAECEFCTPRLDAEPLRPPAPPEPGREAAALLARALLGEEIPVPPVTPSA